MLAGGELRGLGVVAEVLRLLAPPAGAGEVTGVGGTLKLGLV